MEDKSIPFPNKKYNIIYADPPWSYRTWTAKGGHKSASAHYKTMDIEDIKSLPIQDICEKDCVLFIWVTFPNLIEGIDTLSSWGFTYKTCGFVWVKTNKNYNINQTSFLPQDSFNTFYGLGYWTRANSELCLIGTKGKIRRQSNSVHQIIYDPIREHSRKPDCTRDKIVELMGDIPRIELFARQKHEGWDCWGNEV
jgi:N6-adenosine-specific RNA methylase IME4|tara:strand:+ start:2429 stop:3016 length:588 start_codon:yes stop_codon:yes gene_type:complete